MIKQERVAVTTTGSSGSATGSAYSPAFSGIVIDIALDYHASAPATTDTTVAEESPFARNLLVATDSNTDKVYPVRGATYDSAGAAVSGVVDNYVINGRVLVSVAGCDALTNAVIATIRYVG